MTKPNTAPERIELPTCHVSKSYDENGNPRVTVMNSAGTQTFTGFSVDIVWCLAWAGRKPAAMNAQGVQPATGEKVWDSLAEHFVSEYFPNLGRHDVVSREELIVCVAEAMESASTFDLPREPLGELVNIGSVPMGTRVVAPLNNGGIGYMVGTIKMCPYGTGNWVVSDGQSHVTPKMVKIFLQAVPNHE